MMYITRRLILGVIVGLAVLGIWNIRAIHAFPSFTAVIPNGRRVPCPRGVDGCSNAGLCEGVGHGSCAGGSLPLNAFGDGLRSSGYEWTDLFCRLDSDGDGFVNGAEMGDPCCIFQTDNELFKSSDAYKEIMKDAIFESLETLNLNEHIGDLEVRATSPSPVHTRACEPN